MSKWLKFCLIEEKPRTQVYSVVAKMNGDILGVIKWYGAWRKYAFCPSYSTLFNTTCLNDITKFMLDLEDKRLRSMMKKEGSNNGGKAVDG